MVGFLSTMLYLLVTAMWQYWAGFFYLLVTAMWQCYAGMFFILNMFWSSCSVRDKVHKMLMFLKVLKKNILQKGCRGMPLCRIAAANRGVTVKSWKAVRSKRRRWLKSKGRSA